MWHKLYLQVIIGFSMFCRTGKDELGAYSLDFDPTLN